MKESVLPVTPILFGKTVGFVPLKLVNQSIASLVSTIRLCSQLMMERSQQIDASRSSLRIAKNSVQMVFLVLTAKTGASGMETLVSLAI